MSDAVDDGGRSGAIRACVFDVALSVDPIGVREPDPRACAPGVERLGVAGAAAEAIAPLLQRLGHPRIPPLSPRGA